MHPLTRNASRGAQIVRTAAIALILGIVGAIMLWQIATHPRENGTWVFRLVGGGFSFFAVLLLFASIRQLFALRWPVTEVFLDREQLRRGQRAAVHVRQRGPLELESLRANLVGQRRIRRRKSTTYEHLGTFAFFDSGAVSVDEMLPFERGASLDVPDDIPPSGSGVTWQIEVWGKVRGRAGFQHVFPVHVV